MIVLLLLGLGCQSAQATSAGLDGVSATSPGMGEVLDALESRERALDRREKSIEDREAELREVEDELQARLEELEAVRTEIQLLLDGGDEARQERILALIKMTESMRSKQAAVFLAELDHDLAVEVLEGMNRTKAGKALALMAPQTAAKLAESLTLGPIEELNLNAQ